MTPKVGLVVAASDNVPLILVLSQDPTRRSTLEARVAQSAWSQEFACHFTYATGASVKDTPVLKGQTLRDGFLQIEPNTFGTTGQVVTAVSADQISDKLSGAMRDTLRKHGPIAKTRSEMSRKAFEEGVFYEKGIPVSGKGEASDRARNQQQLILKGK